ncbi:MAG: hypothetical protein MZV64_10245 [Ignavibacteriales bacterium]|nr:hypothetical protein [Ignavibacteriales bacterium]
MRHADFEPSRRSSSTRRTSGARFVSSASRISISPRVSKWTPRSRSQAVKAVTCPGATPPVSSRHSRSISVISRSAVWAMASESSRSASTPRRPIW